jgi:hypothetical protein
MLFFATRITAYVAIQLFISNSLGFTQEAEVIPIAGDQADEHNCNRLMVQGSIDVLSNKFMGDWWLGPPMTLMGEKYEITSSAYVENYSVKRSRFRHLLDIYTYVPLPNGGTAAIKVPFVAGFKAVDEFTLGKCGIKNKSRLTPTANLRPGDYTVTSILVKVEVVVIGKINEHGEYIEEQLESFILLDSAADHLRVVKRNWT